MPTSGSDQAIITRTVRHVDIVVGELREGIRDP